MHISERFFNIFPTPRFLKFSYVGVDISPDGFRFAELVNDGKGLKLGRWGEEKVQGTEYIFLNEDLKDKLKETFKKNNITHVKATLPEELTYLFTTEVEGGTPEEIRSNIEFHLEENVPISGNESLFEYYLVPEEEGKKRQAVVSVVSKDTVNKYTDFLQSVGVTSVSYMVESSSLSRTVIPRGDQDTYLLVYLSKKKTVFAVVSHEFVHFSSTINAGSDVINSALKKYFEVDDGGVESLKHSKGFIKGKDNQELFGALATAVSVLRDEIQRVSIYWGTHRATGNTADIKKIILCGSDAVIPGLSEYLGTTLKRDVAVADIWVNIPRYKDEVAPIHFNDSLRFGSCIGLSLAS